MGAKQDILSTTTGSDSLWPDWTRLLVGCRPEDYAASRMARAVEDCDAHLLNLNILPPSACDAAGADDYPMHVELCINHRNPEPVMRSLERYGFAVLSSRSSADSPTRTERNYLNLMRYLEV